jgi:primosomal replication protein N
MGHESHALANHGATYECGTTSTSWCRVSVATSGQSEQTQQIWNQAYGVGSQVGVMLPFSRNHETGGSNRINM